MHAGWTWWCCFLSCSEVWARPADVWPAGNGTFEGGTAVAAETGDGQPQQAAASHQQLRGLLKLSRHQMFSPQSAIRVVTADVVQTFTAVRDQSGDCWCCADFHRSQRSERWLLMLCRLSLQSKIRVVTVYVLCRLSLQSGIRAVIANVKAGRDCQYCADFHCCQIRAVIVNVVQTFTAVRSEHYCQCCVNFHCSQRSERWLPVLCKLSLQSETRVVTASVVQTFTAVKGQSGDCWCSADFHCHQTLPILCRLSLQRSDCGYGYSQITKHWFFTEIWLWMRLSVYCTQRSVCGYKLSADTSCFCYALTTETRRGFSVASYWYRCYVGVLTVMAVIAG